MTAFSAAYTRYMIAPYERRTGSRPGFHLSLTLSLTQELDMTGRTRTEAMTPIVADALNRHAGGERLFGNTPVNVQWAVTWITARVDGGRAVGVSIVDDDVFAQSPARAGHAAAVTLTTIRGGRAFSRILLRSSLFVPRATPATARVRQAQIAHEVGHAMGLDDQRSDPRTTMFFRQLSTAEYRHLTQRWSDVELRTALVNVFNGPGRERPPWL
jgi:hypothetical protein